MVEFSDMIYGKIAIPDWMVPFIRLPEFVRLRGVRLSNVDSYQFKDLNGPTRWEHSIAVAFLALRCAKKRGLSNRETIHLSLAALLHDVATPPFGHTAEYVLENFNSELESQRVLRASVDGDFKPDFPVFASQLPQFYHVCKSLSRKINIKIDPDEVARMVIGDGNLGFLICGSIDLDNADNVIRACLHLGVNVDKAIPIRLAEWLASQDYLPDLNNVTEPAVCKWIEYRSELYSQFYNSSDKEIGREAFLRHLMRRSLNASLPRASLIWKTDESLISTMESLDEAKYNVSFPSLQEMVQRYRLLEPTYLIANVDLETEEAVRVLRSARATAWMEKELSSSSLEPFVIVLLRRFASQAIQKVLFNPAPGAVKVFKLSAGLKKQQLPEWLKNEIPGNVSGKKLLEMISKILGKRTQIWIHEKPWMTMTPDRKDNLLSNLSSVGNWSFRLSRNENMHPYPSTFVHAIPATLINSLGLRGELVLDPFGGTGQTAVEAVKYGGSAISADSNTIANLVARAKLTYLSSDRRSELRSIEENDFLEYDPGNPPNFNLIDKWFHPSTLKELCRIRNFIDSCQDRTKSQFLTACFSAIIVSCTGRRGEQHGYFADNAPLPIGQEIPTRQNALQLFVDRIKRNISVIEQFYAFIEKDERDPKEELCRAKVIQVDATSANPLDYGLQERLVAAIITSPPYLCMSDYTLGQRLSYYWIAPESLEIDYKREIGPRRMRFSPNKASEEYFSNLEKFAQKASKLLKPGGFLATVLGSPLARAFSSLDILGRIDAIWGNAGFELLWSQWRPIYWHRNHGYQRLKKERVSVYILRS